MYYYKRTEPTLWTVGFDNSGGWIPESDHDSSESAATRVAYLNGRSEAIEPQATNQLLERIAVALERIAACVGGEGGKEKFWVGSE